MHPSGIVAFQAFQYAHKFFYLISAQLTERKRDSPTKERMGNLAHDILRQKSYWDAPENGSTVI